VAERGLEFFVRVVDALALGMEGVAVLLITCAAAHAFATLVSLAATRRLRAANQKAVWLGMARWLVLALEFQLAADLVHTAISRTWTDVGHVAALALIRTFLNYALEADLEREAAAREHAPAAPAPDVPPSRDFAPRSAPGEGAGTKASKQPEDGVP
jgi:uncharacterized membrane protein